MNITFNQFTKTTYPYLDDSYIDKYVPVAYGKIASVELTPINSNYDTDNGNVAAVYRMPDGMTNYGTAYVKVDDTWVAATVSSVDYDTGLITISNGRASSGSTYECKLTDCYGYMFDGHCYPRQALQHWYATYGNIQYTDSNFNKTEWVAALDDSRYQADFGLLLDDYSKDEDSDNTYDLDYFNKIVYNIATFGGKMYCRIDYDLSGKITATLKDYDRTASDTIASADIYDNNTLSATTTADSAYTSVIEKYYHNTVDDNYLSLEDNTYEKYVKQNYRIMQSLTDKSYLINEADAKTRAAELALEYKHIPVEFEINVRDRYTTRLYSVVTVALMPDNLDSSMRQYAGNKDCLVTGVAPLPDSGYTTLTLQIIPDRTASVQQASVRNSAYTTVARSKSSTQIITDNLQTQITDNLLLTGSLSLISINLNATTAGVVSDFSAATGVFNVKYSGTDVTGAGPVYSVVSQTGCTGTIDESTGVYAVSALSADVGILLLKATYEGQEIEISFTVTKAYAGTDGTAGRGISSTTITYQVGTSGTTAPTGTWTTEIPTPAEGQYLWTKIYIVYTDETNSTSYSVAYAPSDGNDGTGISSTAIAYQMGTSGTTAPTGTWTTAIPTLVQGEYLWTRTVFTYTDATTKTVYSVSYIATDGTDSTAITISDPNSTSPQSGMKYNNTYYGIYNGVWYKWTWNSSTTGYWTQVSADTPPTPAVRYSFDEMPDLPDDSGAIYKAEYKGFTSTAYWSADNGIIALSDGCITNTATAASFNTNFNKGVSIANKIVKIIFKISQATGAVSFVYNTGTFIFIPISSSLVQGKIYEISILLPSDATTNTLILNINGVSSGAILTILSFYIGDGTTSQPIIDNISGTHNSVAQSGVVSTTGVSGKACQFLGYKAVSLDLSAYANAQSWWVSAWLNIPSASFVNYKEVFTGSSGSYRKLWWYIDDSELAVSLLKTTQSNVTIPVASIADGWHNVISQIVVYSSSETIVKVYLDGKLYDSMTVSQDFTDLLFSTVYLGGVTETLNVVSGSMDDFQFGVGEITASQVLGLYLQRASAAKLYTLADYNYDNSVSSWEITSSAASFSKSRSGVVTPSTVTFSAKAVIASVATAYSGRFIIYTSTDGTTFTSVYTSSADESSHAYSPASNIAAIRVELYKAGGTSTMVATHDYSVPYAADVAPEYLGIGLLADVDGLTTKAFTSATITDAGVITPGSTISNIIPGDWIINYTAGTYRALGIYYWSGSAWTLTTDSKYMSDGVIEDICRLNNGGILIPDWTVYVNLIADNLFSHTIKLTTKTISGVTYEGVFYGGDRFNADGTIADRSANGFYFKTDGRGWCNLQSDDLDNTIMGTDAGLQLMGGSGNIGHYNNCYGHYAGLRITTGYSNNCYGDSAGLCITTGHYNNCYGHYAGYNITTGNYNNCYGDSAGFCIATGYSNNCYGDSAGHNITTGNYNNCYGHNTNVYNPTWSFQMNLNNRVMYLEFNANATQDTVYKAISNYISTAGQNVGAFGCFGSQEITRIYNSGGTVMQFVVNADASVLNCTSGSPTKIGYSLQVMFIIPATPTNI